MRVIRKYAAIKVNTQTVDDSVNVSLSFGKITGPYYSQEHPKESFDTEEQAIEYAYKSDRYSNWFIVPVVSFGYE